MSEIAFMSFGWTSMSDFLRILTLTLNILTWFSVGDDTQMPKTAYKTSHRATETSCQVVEPSLPHRASVHYIWRWASQRKCNESKSSTDINWSLLPLNVRYIHRRYVKKRVPPLPNIHGYIKAYQSSLADKHTYANQAGLTGSVSFNIMQTPETAATCSQGNNPAFSESWLLGNAKLVTALIVSEATPLLPSWLYRAQSTSRLCSLSACLWLHIASTQKISMCSSTV